MSKIIMLSFLSTYRFIGTPKRLIESKYRGDDSIEIKGEHTNEAALKYIYNSCGALDKYFCFVSAGCKVTANYVDENDVPQSKSHYELFEERVGRDIPDFGNVLVPVSYEEADLLDENSSNENAADMNAVKSMANAILDYAKGENMDVVLYVDMTGGFRHASLLMLAVVELLKYSDIKIGKILYSNYNAEAKFGKVEDVTNIHDLMQMAAGAEAFVTYGKIDVLKKYFAKYVSSESLKALLIAMEKFADALGLCRSGMLVEAAKGLRRAMDDFSNSQPECLQEILFQDLLLQRVEKEYKIIGDGSDRLALIKWCLQKDFLQQAMTLYTEWVPDVIVEKKIFYTDDESVKNECKVNKFTPWSKTLLSHYVCSTAKCSNVIYYDEDSNTANLFKNYALSESEQYKKMLLTINDNECGCISQVMTELEQNDEVVAMMKSGAITFDEVKLKYPKLYSIVYRMYYGNPHSIPSQPLEDYWKNRIDKIKLRNIIKTLPLKFVEELLELAPVVQAADAIVVENEVTLITSAKHHIRRKQLKKMLDCGVTNTDVDKEVALQICDEYNKIRDLRNHINHANEDIIDARKVKKEISIYLDNLEHTINTLAKK